MLTVEEIKQFITDDSMSEKKRLARVGQRYYEGEHDILQYRMFYYDADGILREDRARANNRICHPFFTEIADQVAPFILSFKDSPIQAKDQSNGLQEHLDLYFDGEFWSEVSDVITGTVAKGFDYLYAYKNTDDRLAFHCADGLGVVEIRAKDTDDGCEYVIYWYIDRIDKGKKRIKRIQVHDKDQIYFYVQVDEGEIILDDSEPINPLPHIVWKDRKTGSLYGKGLGFIPFWRLDNNKKQFSGLKPIKALIDDYDLMECGLSNNLQDFDTPIHLVKGFMGDDLNELQQNIKTKKIMGVDTDGGLDVLTVDIPYQARKTKADEDEKNIYKFGMGFNSSQTGDGNITNVVIKSRYTLLQLKAQKLVTRLERFLKDIVDVVLTEINNKNGTDYKITDVDIDFSEFNIPTNEQENVQNTYTKAQTEQVRINNILNASTIIGDDETLKGICDILDLDELKDQLERTNEPLNTLNAMNTLNGVVTDEQTTEISTGTIPEQ